MIYKTRDVHFEAGASQSRTHSGNKIAMTKCIVKLKQGTAINWRQINSSDLQKCLKLLFYYFTTKILCIFCVEQNPTTKIWLPSHSIDVPKNVGN